MRIEVQDEAARLRIERTEIVCVQFVHVRTTATLVPFPASLSERREAARVRECRDCGRCRVTECRCAPGEA